MSVIGQLAAVASGFLVGVLSGVMGVGGGILLVPIMVLGFGFAQHLAQGTSLAAIIPTSIAGAVTHDRMGNVDRRAAAWMGIAGVLGSVAGAFFAIALPKGLLVRLFGLFILYSAYRLWPGRKPK